MAITGQTPWRQIGDVDLGTFCAAIPAGSPLLDEAGAIYNAVRGDSVLYLAQARMESSYATTGIATTGGHNALGNKKPGGNNENMRFASWAEGAAWWRARIRDPAGPYAGTTSIASYVHVYAPSSDGNDEARYVQVICEAANRIGATKVADKLVFGRVPFPGYVDRQALTANKPEGVGWDNIALWGDKTRTPMFVVLHRMYGTMAGTDSPGWFGSPTVGALTDYGMGNAGIDGDALDGVIVQWNNPRGYRVPWASGPVSAPYGDGLKWLNWSENKWGLSICNACGVSIENSGYWGDPETDFAFGELAKFVAYWFDQFGIAYDKAPIHPKTGFSAICWHQEFTIGTGKICPGDWLMSNTQRLIDAAAAIMQPYQTGSVPTPVPAPTPQPAPAPAPKPVPAPAPQYAKPVEIPELAPFTAQDKDSAAAVVHRGETDFVWVNDTVKVTKDTPRLQYADAKSAKVGPDLKAGETLNVLWECKAGDGQDYYITGQWTRLRVADTVRVKD